LNKYGSFIEKFMPLETFFEEYDNIDGISRLKVECAKKLKKQTKKSLELSKYFTNEQLIHSLKNTVKLTQMQRAFRVKPHILIVDDQVFSQKILETILKDYTCHIADSSGEALLVYMEKCPDIVFLDIELPDINGHHFAKLANRIDENAYIVMVSGNKQQEEIKTALSNNVKGFIAKPYEKQTILKIVDQYANIKSKNLRHKQL
nr:response regulator [Micavibrio sp.]